MNKGQKSCFKLIKKYYEISEVSDQIENNRSKDATTSNILEELYLSKRKLEGKIIDLVRKEFDEEDMDFIQIQMIPFFKKQAKIKSDRFRNNLESEPFKRWIVQRVFELGYNMIDHGRYDKDLADFTSRYNDSEKIGFKYQKIALQEILAAIADNHKIKSRSDNGRQYDFYKGAWQLYSRDIDPVTTTKTIDSDNENNYDNEQFWWSKVNYQNWGLSNQEWSNSLDDLPKVNEVILKTDDKKNEWLFLEYHQTWEEPKKIGEDRYLSRRKNLHYLINSYLVRSEDKVEIFNYLREKNFFGRWMPENGDAYTNIFNREKFWSPAFIDTFGKESDWKDVYDNKTHTTLGRKVMISTTNAKGSIESDKSGANLNYDIPCKTLFEGLDLKYSSIDGEFVNKSGELIVTNKNIKGTLIRKKELFEYLESNNYSIIWTVLGEKIAVSKDGYYHIGVPCGTFHIEDDNLIGDMKMYTRDS